MQIALEIRNAKHILGIASGQLTSMLTITYNTNIHTITIRWDYEASQRNTIAPEKSLERATVSFWALACGVPEIFPMLYNVTTLVTHMVLST